MDRVVYYNELYDLYSSLLTDKQRKYFEDYYFNNLSFSEIADKYGISRNAAFKQIHIITDKLDEYESKLELYNKKHILIDIINSTHDSDIKKKLEEIIY